MPSAGKLLNFCGLTFSMFCWVNSTFLLIIVHIFPSQLMICVYIPVTFPLISICFCSRNHFSGECPPLSTLFNLFFLRFLILSTCFPHFFQNFHPFFPPSVSSSAGEAAGVPGARRHGDLFPVLRLRQRLRRGGWKAAGGEPWVPGRYNRSLVLENWGKNHGKTPRSMNIV